MFHKSKIPPKDGISYVSHVVDDVRIVFQQKNEYVYIPDLNKYPKL